MLCALVAPAHGQSTKAQINTQIITNLPDNTVGQITPQGLRTVTSNIVNSIMPTAPVVAGNLACFSGTTGLLKDCGPGLVGLTMSGLRALLAPTNGATQYVNGYYAAGDGGQGQFTFNAASSATDNGGTIIAPTSGTGRWLRDYSGAINPDWFGAGDVSSVADSSAAFTGALGVATAAISASSGKTYVVSNLSIPSGISVYLNGSSLRLPAASSNNVMTLVGANSTVDCGNGSIIMPVGATPANLVYFNRTTNGTIQNCNLPNANILNIQAEGTVSTLVKNNTIGVSVQAYSGVWFSNSLRAAFTASISSATLTVTGITFGAVAVGDTIYGSGIPEGTTIIATGTGSGGTGTYTISKSLTVASENINSGPRVIRDSQVINNYFADNGIMMTSDGGAITNNYFIGRTANFASTNIGSPLISFDNRGVPGSYYANNIIITGNVMDGVPSGPLSDSDCMELMGTNFVVSGNTCKNSQRQGIILHSVQGATITGNSCENVGLGGGGLSQSVCVMLTASLGSLDNIVVAGNKLKDAQSVPTSRNFCTLEQQNYVSTFTGSILKNTLTVTAGSVNTGTTLTGSGVTAGTVVLGQLNTGLYWVSIPQTVASTVITQSSPYTIHDVTISNNEAEGLTGTFCPQNPVGGGTVIGANVLVYGNQGGGQPDNLGTVTALNVTASGDIGAGAGSSFFWPNRSVVRSLADGNIELYNSTQNSFGLLQFGGITSSFPALKRSATSLQARLADDSDFAPFQTANLTVNGDSQVGSSNAWFWSGRSVLRSPADGNIWLSNSAATGFGLLQFGGISSSFPAIKPSGAGLQVRLADDSGFTALQASTFTGALAGNATTATTASAVAVGGVTGLGTGVATALGVNVGTAGAPVVNGGALGTPSSGIGTNLTGTAASLTAGTATALATPRAIAITGSTGLTATGVNFDGSSAINLSLGGTLAVANGGACNGVWPSFTPAITFTGGTTPASVNQGSSTCLEGKKLFYRLAVQITYAAAPSVITWTLPASLLSAGNEVAFGLNISSFAFVFANFGGGATANINQSGGAAAVSASGQYLVLNGMIEVQ